MSSSKLKTPAASEARPRRQNSKLPPTAKNFLSVRCGFAFYALRFEFRKGFGLIEVMVAVGIVTAVFFAFIQTGTTAVRLLRSEKENLEATLFAKEGLEAVRSVRDESWTFNIAPLADGIPYYPRVLNNEWVLWPSSPGLLNGKYDRYILFQQVLRDAQDRIAASGTADANTRRVVSRVLWGTSETPAVSFQNGTTDGNLANFPSNNAGDGDPVQEFRTPAGSPTTVSSVDLLLKRVGNPSDVYLEIRGGNQVGSVLASSPVLSASSISSSGLAWVKFPFPNQPVLWPNQYFLRLRSTPSSTDAFSGSSGAINWGYLQSGGSPYPDGDAWRYVGRLSNPSDLGQRLTQYDFAFVVNRQIVGGKQIELVTYITNFQEPIAGVNEVKIVSFEGATTDADLANFPDPADAGNGDPSQSFTTPASPIQVTKMELLLKKAVASPSNIYAEIRPKNPTGTILGTSNLINSATLSNSSFAWVEFRFSNPVSLNASTVYTIRLRSDPPSTDVGSGTAGPIPWRYLQTAGSPYSGGDARRYIGRLSNPNDAGQLLDQYDFGFRVYGFQ